ncbi:glycosyltransferase [Bacillus sp. BRMEA1]|uniref:glycosyltransferase n=1 Tax=Neobacillus endophyticus TaxID=2738405 RepID=UPI001565F46F|nr:glycosyltransferase [Neobacillus endophyticus]NRD76720.1 glycosyltransferase [Neobacillus endophyticus]
MDKVSIVIPVYNCPFVGHAIESALNQTYPNIEIIVVNDGSSEEFTEKIRPYIPKIHRYIEKANGGTASALNAGIQHATGDYFCWLSSDDRYDPQKVQKQHQFMSECQADVSYSDYVYIDANNSILSGSLGISFPNRLQFLEQMKKGCFINGCTVMMKMSVFSEAGLFDESLPYTHDYDLWLRVLKYRHFYYLNEPLVLYRVHDGMGTKKHEQEILKEIVFVQQKHQAGLDQLILEELLK